MFRTIIWGKMRQALLAFHIWKRVQSSLQFRQQGLINKVPVSSAAALRRSIYKSNPQQVRLLAKAITLTLSEIVTTVQDSFKPRMSAKERVIQEEITETRMKIHISMTNSSTWSSYRMLMANYKATLVITWDILRHFKSSLGNIQDPLQHQIKSQNSLNMNQ